MMTRIFRAIPATCRLILLGDADQLPSVSAGSVLTDLAPRPHLGYSKENISYLKEVTGADLSLVSQQGIDAPKNSDHLTFLQKSRRFDGEGGIGLIASAVISGDSALSWKLLNHLKIPIQNKAFNFEKLKQVNLLPTDFISCLPDLVETHYQPLFSCKTVISAFQQLSKI